MKIEVQNLQTGHEISCVGGRAIVKSVLRTSGEFVSVTLKMPEGNLRLCSWKPRTKIKVHNIPV
jgi:hypothetical protein